MKEWIKHAFAVDPAGPAEPREAERAGVERFCAGVVRRHMTTPVLLFLEMSRPMNYLGAQALHFLTPMISAVVSGDDHKQLASFLERRGSIDYICRRIEELESERSG